MRRPRKVIFSGVGALALALCAGLSDCSEQQQAGQPKNAEQQQAQPQGLQQPRAEQPPSAEQQQAQPQTAEQQQQAQPRSPQQSRAEQPPSTEQPQAQPQTAEQQQAQPQTPQQSQAEQPQTAEQQPAQPKTGGQQAQQPQSAEQQQPQSKTTEQQQAPQPQGADQQAQNQTENRQNASNGRSGTAAVDLDRDQIERVQRALDQKGFKTGRADGKIGPKTESALRSFQQQQKLQTTGKIDQETLAALGLNDLTTTGQGRGQQQPPVSGQQERTQ